VTPSHTPRGAARGVPLARASLPRQIVTERRTRELVLRCRNGVFVRETRITVNEDATIEDDGLRLYLSLAPREERRIPFVITPHSDQHDRAHIARRRAGSF
jgi:hypothetical protein